MTSETSLLEKIDDADDLHRTVVAKWRWVRIGVPVNAAAVFAGGLFGGYGMMIGVDTGGIAISLIGFGLFAMLLCVLWFGLTTPRRDATYSSDRTILHPHETRRMATKARRKHLEYCIEQGEKNEKHRR